MASERSATVPGSAAPDPAAADAAVRGTLERDFDSSGTTGTDAVATDGGGEVTVAASPDDAPTPSVEAGGADAAREADDGSAGPAVPPVEVVMSEVVASLALAAHAYMLPAAGNEGGEPDLGAAEIAIDVAAKAFERIGPRLSPGQRSAMASMLTDLRFTFVKKRGT